MSVEFSKGLEGVIADQTSISNVEGDVGRLSYRGYRIEDLVTLNFTKVMWLVLFGELPSQDEEAKLNRFLQGNGQLSTSEIEILKALPRDVAPPGHESGAHGEQKPGEDHAEFGPSHSSIRCGGARGGRGRARVSRRVRAASSDAHGRS